MENEWNEWKYIEMYENTWILSHFHADRQLAARKAKMQPEGMRKVCASKAPNSQATQENWWKLQNTLKLDEIQDMKIYLLKGSLNFKWVPDAGNQWKINEIKHYFLMTP